MPKKVYTGEVINNTMDKTVTVAVSRLYQHPLYKKIIRKTVKLKVHDENNQSKVGDMVEIRESRPLSKTKRWVLINPARKEHEGDTG
ncbi:MAG: 30S ribosomal protein S17 [Nitrospirae bacterium]|nr:30S ribosomal protein S17 [Nitrospirota bacterium]MBF0592205.1 30S ribosomal protein S17 [Nitrospirota bacterium]